MRFFEIECPNRVEIIVARSKFEAFGYVALSKDPGTDYTSDITIRQELPKNHEVEVSCVGFPKYKTLEEMYLESTSEERQIPFSLCKLAW